MSKGRFLRDNVLTDMLTEIKNMAEQVEKKEMPSLLFSNSLAALAEMYETNKLVLQRLEETIQRLRDENQVSDLVDPIVEAAAHIQLGLVTIHNSLKEDISQMLEAIEDIKKSRE